MNILTIRETDAKICAGRGFFSLPFPSLSGTAAPMLTGAIITRTSKSRTQGSEKKNENNHPFSGNVGNTRFALAHNGVLYNDKTLRRELKLPDTKIETDSYVAVQLLEKYGKLDFDSLRFMSEELEGSFTITALSDRDELFIAKGNNPVVIQHFPDSGLYVYASTEEILQKALLKTGLPLGRTERISMYTGELWIKLSTTIGSKSCVSVSAAKP